MSLFEFRNFSVQQQYSPLKVSTDAILLGATVKVAQQKARVLDVGTGNGVIALLIASRFEAVHIDAIDTDPNAIQDAQFNFENAPFALRIRCFQTELAAHCVRDYDLIVSNPPYFLESLMPAQRADQQAKHLTKKAFLDLLLQMKHRLCADGALWLILPPQSANAAIEYLNAEGMYLRLKLRFHANQRKPDKRWVLCFSFDKGHLEQSEFYIRNLDGSFHEDYKRLAGLYHNRPL